MLSLPKECQIIVYSATYTSDLIEYLQKCLNSPKFIHAHDPSEESGQTEEQIDEIQLKTIQQYYFVINSGTFEEKLKILAGLIEKTKYNQCMIFFNQKVRGVEIANFLK